MAAELLVRHASPRRPLRRCQQQIAVAEALQRVEQVKLGLTFALENLRLLEEEARLLPLAALVQGIGGGGAFAHPLERIATAVGELDGLLGIGHRLLDSTKRHFQLVEVAGKSRRIYPQRLLDPHRQARPHRLHRLGEAP